MALDGADASIVADPDQLEQLIINLVANAVDAAGADGSVCVRWSSNDGKLQLEVLDSGPGLGDTDNLSRNRAKSIVANASHSENPSAEGPAFRMAN